MNNMKAKYGDKLFDGSAYKNQLYIAILTSLFVDALVCWFIITTFKVEWENSFFKVFSIICVFDFARYLLGCVGESIEYKYATKKIANAEVRHYMGIFKDGIDWGNVGTYEDVLYEATFSETLPCDDRVLAAMQYAKVLTLVSVNPKFDGRFWKLHCKNVDDFLKVQSSEKIESPLP